MLTIIDKNEWDRLSVLCLGDWMESDPDIRAAFPSQKKRLEIGSRLMIRVHDTLGEIEEIRRRNKAGK